MITKNSIVTIIFSSLFQMSECPKIHCTLFKMIEKNIQVVILKTSLDDAEGDVTDIPRGVMVFQKNMKNKNLHLTRYLSNRKYPVNTFKANVHFLHIKCDPLVGSNWA